MFHDFLFFLRRKIHINDFFIDIFVIFFRYCLILLTLSRTGSIFPSTARGGVNLTQTYLTASEGPIRHILCNIIEGTFKGKHQ